MMLTQFSHRAKFSLMANLLWIDGRSGIDGCIAGNAALDILARAEGPIARVKGTVFESANAILVGRVCANADYLGSAILHWANTSWDQHEDLRRLASDNSKELAYLFVTSTLKSLEFWRVPGKVVEDFIRSKGKARRGSTCAIHIVDDEHRHRIGAIDVSMFHVGAPLPNQTAPEVPDGSSSQLRITDDDEPHKVLHPIREAKYSVLAEYHVPMSNGGVVTLQVPMPVQRTDLDRLKGWIDLMADLLTSPVDDAKIAQERSWLQAAVQAGVDQLDRGLVVNGEDAFDRVLNRRASNAVPR